MTTRLGRRFFFTSGLRLVVDRSDPARTFVADTSHSVRLGALNCEQRGFLRTLANPQIGIDPDGAGSQQHSGILGALELGNMLRQEVSFDAHLAYTIEPTRPPQRHDVLRLQGSHGPTLPLQVSRFAVATFSGGKTVLESGFAWRRILISQPLLVAALPSLHPSDNRLEGLLADDLWRAGLAINDAGMEQEGALGLWSPHEAWFHSKSRRSSTTQFGVDFGARALPKRPMSEIKPQPQSTPPIFLPSGGRRASQDISLSEAIARRKSIRDYDEQKPLTVTQLSAILFEIVSAPGKVGSGRRRRYPAGGSLYELEVLLFVRLCVGLAPGAYRYRAEDHSLQRLDATVAAAASFIADASQAMAGTSTPQVLLGLEADIPRLLIKYAAIGYSLILKHVGVLMEAFSLACAAEKVACCALGTGNSDMLTQILHADAHTHVLVGEIALGSMRPEDRQA